MCQRNAAELIIIIIIIINFICYFPLTVHTEDERTVVEHTILHFRNKIGEQKQ